ncbi:MAG TPA: energy transducer TonB [Allosphingosinicella sp.]|nr:energy transducer TonB [Allosphingosinicella sp.]
MGLWQALFGLLAAQKPVPEAPPVIMMPPAPPPVRGVPPVYLAPSPPSPPLPPQPGVVAMPEAIGREAWIRTDDYPAAALRSEEQGLVMVVLTVGPNGRVRDCQLTFSSESAALDARTCRLFRSRARYRPARNVRGRPVAARLRERVRWVLPPESVRFEASYALVQLRQVDGRVGTCRRATEIPAYGSLPNEICSTFAPVGLPVPDQISQGHTRFAIALRIAPDGAPAIVPPPPPAGLRPMLEANAEVELDERGAIRSCRSRLPRPPRSIPGPRFDLCTMLRRPGVPLFHAPGEEGAVSGRVELTIYMDVTAR